MSLASHMINAGDKAAIVRYIQVRVLAKFTSICELHVFDILLKDPSFTEADIDLIANIPYDYLVFVFFVFFFGASNGHDVLEIERQLEGYDWIGDGGAVDNH